MSKNAANTQNGNDWIGKVYTITGSWEITQSRMLIFGEDFKTTSGPDLKLYLVPKTMETINNRDQKTDSWVYIDELKTQRGAQEYYLPKGIDLSKHKSVIIHCTAYAVVWGGFNLKQE